jgi:Chitobiase/beta-hexosaminidase C-terminal domain
MTLSNASYVSGSEIKLTDLITNHTTNGADYQTQQDISKGFRAVFTFQQQISNVIIPATGGIAFRIHNATNSGSQTVPDGNWFINYNGTAPGYSSDANVAGYGCYDPSAAPLSMNSNISQQYVVNSVAIKFDMGNANGLTNYINQASSTGLYLNGGNYQSLNPAEDLQAEGINFFSTDIFQATVTDDPVNNLLTLVLLDTNTGASARRVWPVNIQAVVGQNLAWMGVSGGNAQQGSSNIASGWVLLSFEVWNGYTAVGATYSQLAAPTFSVTPGQYTSSQSVSLSGPAGASIYYTTNGLAPTTASTLWTGTPISVSSNMLIQAVAIQSGYTDSTVAVGNYQIQSGGSPIINFPSGFASMNGLMQLNGVAALSGSSLLLNSTAYSNQVGTAWYATPIPVSSNWVATFKLNFGTGSGNGLAFVVQNYPPASTDGPRINNGWAQNVTTASGLTIVGGGPHFYGGAGDALGYANNWGLGYNPSTQAYGGSGADGQGGLAPGYQSLWNSFAIAFDIWNGNVTGLYTQGAVPYGSGISLTTGGTVTGGGITLNSGHDLNCTVTYNASAQTVTLAITDATTGGTFTNTWSSINVGTLVGATGYVGFTASGGGATMNALLKALTVT